MSVVRKDRAKSCLPACRRQHLALVRACGSGSTSDSYRKKSPCASSRSACCCFCVSVDAVDHRRTPDYSITPLAVATPVPAKADSGDASSKAAGRACPSPQGRPYKQRGQVSKHLQRKTTDTLQLSKKEEGQLAAAWKALPGACMQQCGALDQQLQTEGQAQEQLRWGGLPAAVKARGQAWWV